MKTLLNNAWALLIGVGAYTDWTNIQELSAPPKETRNFYNWLLSNGVSKSRITMLLDKNANRRNILRELQNLQETLCNQDKMPELVLVYYAGHTLLEADLFDMKSSASNSPRENIRYLAPQDAQYTYLSESAIKLREFKHMVLNLYSKCVITFMDSCHSGGDEISLGGNSAVTIPKNFWESANSPMQQRIILSASYPDQQAYQKNDEQLHFTCRVLEALNGKAKCDENGQISLQSVFDYVKENFKSVRKPQTPHIWDPQKVSANIILAIDRRKWLHNKFQERIKQEKLALDPYLQERLFSALKDKGAAKDQIIDALETFVNEIDSKANDSERPLETLQTRVHHIDSDTLIQLSESLNITAGSSSWIQSAWTNRPLEKQDPNAQIISALERYLCGKYDNPAVITKALEKRRNAHLQHLKRLVKEDQLLPFTPARWDWLIKCHLKKEKPKTEFEQALVTSIKPLCNNDIDVAEFLNNVAVIIDERIVYLSQEDEKKFRPTWLTPLRAAIKWSTASQNKNAIESTRLCWMILFNEVADSEQVATNDLLEVAIEGFKRSQRLSRAAYKEALTFLGEEEYESAAEAFSVLFKHGAPDPQRLLSPPTELISQQKVPQAKNKAVNEMLFPDNSGEKRFPDTYRLLADYLLLLNNQEKFQKQYHAAINSINKVILNEKPVLNSKLKRHFDLSIDSFSELAEKQCLPPGKLFSGKRPPQLKDDRLSRILLPLLEAGEYDTVAAKLRDIMRAIEKAALFEAISLSGYYHDNALPLLDDSNPYEILRRHKIHFNSSLRQLKDLMSLKNENEKTAWQQLRKVDKRIFQDWFLIPAQDPEVFAEYARNARGKFSLPNREALTRLLDKNNQQDYAIALMVLEDRTAACEFLERFIRKTQDLTALHQHSHTLGIIYFANAVNAGAVTDPEPFSKLRLALGFMVFNIFDDAYWDNFREKRQTVYQSEVSSATCEKIREEIYRTIRHWLLRRVENCTLSKLSEAAGVYRQLYLELKAEYRCATLLKRIGGLPLTVEAGPVITGGYISLKHFGLKQEVRRVIAREEESESDTDATLTLSSRELRQLPLLFSGYAMLVIMMEENPESGLAILKPMLAKRKTSRYYHLLTLLAIEGMIDLASRSLKDPLPSNEQINAAITQWQAAYDMAHKIDRRKIVRQQIINYAHQRLQIFENAAIKADEAGDARMVIQLTTSAIGFTETIFRKLFDKTGDRKVAEEYLVVLLANLYARQGFTRYYALNSYQSAAKDLRKSIELNPQDYNNRIDFVHALMNAGDYLYFRRREMEAKVFYQEVVTVTEDGIRRFPHKERLQRYHKKAQECLNNGPKLLFDDWLEETEQ